MNHSNSEKLPQLFAVSSAQDDLWARFRNGESDALAKIYRLYIDDLYHYGMHFCKDDERVKDCLQDLFHDLWSERMHLSLDIKNVKYYLLSSLRRRLLRSIQKDKRYQIEELDNTFNIKVILPRENDLVMEEIYKEKTTRIQKAIASLSRRQQEVIYLRFYQGLSNLEIAEIMSVKVESVYNLFSKAISLLQKMLLLFLLALAC